MPERPRTAAPGARSQELAGALFAVAWLAYFTALQWSVVRYRIPIVATLTLSTLALAAWQVRGWSVRLTRPSVAVALTGSALATLAVPLFSYLGPTGLAVATTALVVGSLVCAGCLATGSGLATKVALTTAVAAYVVTAATAVTSSPRPRIDVWVTLQQAADGLARGENIYAMTWTGSPGIQDAFTYLPWTAVLLAPGRWLVGDVRWALTAWTLVALLGVWLLARGVGGRHRASTAWTATAVAGLLVFAPGTLTQLDQAWTEPLLLAGLVWWAVLVQRDRAWWAVIPLALACASKQHLALLLPVLLVWRPFGWRRTLATGALTGLLLAPWFLAGPADFVHDTVTLLLSFHPIRFANTLYLLALNTFGVTLPFVVTGVVVLGTLGAVVWVVRRRQPALGVLVRWLALVLMVANLVNKQAFYNQFWLVGALVAVSLTLEHTHALRPPEAGRRSVGTAAEAGQPAFGSLRGAAEKP